MEATEVNLSDTGAVRPAIRLICYDHLDLKRPCGRLNIRRIANSPRHNGVSKTCTEVVGRSEVGTPLGDTNLVYWPERGEFHREPTDTSSRTEFELQLVSQCSFNRAEMGSTILMLRNKYSPSVL